MTTKGCLAIFLPGIVSCAILSGTGYGQGQLMGDPDRPNYDSYRMENLVNQGEANYAGDLNISIPILTVPGRHGHDFTISLKYNSNLTQRQSASWVGLGWDLELGAAERTVMGRIDELGTIAPGTLRYQMAGWLTSAHDLVPADSADQPDLYSLHIDGGSDALLPFRTGFTNQFELVPVSYKPWRTLAYGSDGVIYKIITTKEDGANYEFGGSSSGGNSLALTTRLVPYGSGNPQFEFSYRLPLKEITYPDGSRTRISYKFSNEWILDEYGTVFIDRGWADGAAGNFFGAGGNSYYHGVYPQGTVNQRHAWPDTLFTDTHYAVFEHDGPSGSAQSKVHRQLNKIVLRELGTNIELKRVLFTYAPDTNSAVAYIESNPPSIGNWNEDQQLNNNQLTLVSVQTVYGSPVEELIPPYVFTYHKNPKVDWFYQVTYSRMSPSFRGYHIAEEFSYAWKLKTVKLPTGASIEYQYEPINTGNFKVLLDPEGRVASEPNHWSYGAPPRARLKEKKVTDPLGMTQQWRFSYGEAIYDPPSILVGMNYMPYAYRPEFPAADFYKFYGGCIIGHRWINVTNPDSSWVKTSYSSSYRDELLHFRESWPDSILEIENSNQSNIIAVRSFGPARGLAWKVETPSSVTINSYFPVRVRTSEARLEYYYLNMPGNLNHKAQVSSWWTRLDSVITTRDGVTSFTAYEYTGLPTIEERGNTLLRRSIEGGSYFSRVTDYVYAYEIDTTNQLWNQRKLSQIHSVRISKNQTEDEKKAWTFWTLSNEKLLPIEEWVWEGLPGESFAPVWPGGPQSKRTKRFAYDSLGLANVVYVWDANNNGVRYYYGDSTNPFSTTSAGLSKGRPTGTIRSNVPLAPPPPVFLPFVQVSPGRDQTNVTIPVDFRWTSVQSATEYELHVFSHGANYDKTFVLADTTYELNEALSPLSWYEWNVTARSSFGDIARTPTWAFRVEDDPQNPTQHSDTVYVLTAYAYDHHGNIVRKVTANGDTTRFTFDRFGRIASIIAPGGKNIARYTYQYVVGGLPNSIAQSLRTSASDSMYSILYYDGVGYEIQRVVALGAEDLVTAKTYDLMRRTDRLYKPFQGELPTPHRFDPDFISHAEDYHQNTNGYPFSRTTYFNDGLNRARASYGPGSLFQDENQGRFVKFSYGSEPLGTINTVAPVSTSHSHSLWAPHNVGSLHEALADDSDDTYARVSYEGDQGDVDFVVPLETIQPVSDSLDAYVIKFRSRKYDNSNTSIFGGGEEFGLDSYSPWLRIELLDQGVRKALGWVDWYSYPSQFATLTLHIPASAVQHPAELSIRFTAGGNFGEGDRIDISRARLETWSAQLFRTTTINEHNVKMLEFKDAFGNTVATVADSGGEHLVTRSYYDVRGNLIKSTNPKGQVSVLQYNSLGQLALKSTPDGGTTRYKYDNIGNLRFIQDDVQRFAEFERFTYTKYDFLNRAVEVGEAEGDFNVAVTATSGIPELDYPEEAENWKVRNVYDVNIENVPSARNLLERLSLTVVNNAGVQDSTFYSYDEFGRVEWQLVKLSGLSPKKLVYNYDWQGNVIQLGYLDQGNPNNNTWFSYEYDQAGRLSRAFSSLDSSGTARVQEADYRHLPSGQVKRLQLGLAQGLDYVYNERDWLTSANHQNLSIYQDPGKDGANGIPVDRLGMVFGYHNIEHIGAEQNATPQYNGNISWMMYNIFGVTNAGAGVQTPLVGYTFGYDNISRLASADFGKYDSIDGWIATQAFDLPSISYDQNGNIVEMGRYGVNATQMDDLTYNYLTGTNKLGHVQDLVNASSYAIDIDNQSSGNYVYDAKGNMIRDNQANMDLVYDYRNLPMQVTKSGVITDYRYDAAGKRTYKSVANGETVYYIYDAAGRNIAVLNANGSIRMMNIHGADHIGYMAVSYDQGHEEEEETDGPAGGPAEEEPIEPEIPPGEGVVGGEGVIDNEGSNVPEPDSTSTEVLVTGPGGRIDKRFYYLKDHLGSVRATVQAGHMMLWEDFNANLDQWRYIEGSGFQISNDRLINVEEGEQMIIDAVARVLDDGIVTVDVRFEDEVPVLDNPYAEPEVALLIRYRNPQGYYAVGFSNNDIALYRRTSSGFEQVAYAGLSVTGFGVAQKLQVTADGNRLIVFWNGEYIFHWDDPNPWLTGKVGFRHVSSSAVQWDNIRVTTGGPGKMVAYDDYDPWGMILEGRSGNVGNAEARFKFTGKERDTETGFDYFGARYYDARIGRWLSVDPLAEKELSIGPYAYVANSPLTFFDPDGKEKFTIILRTWIHWSTFRGIVSDNRPADVNGKTYRTQQIINIDTNLDNPITSMSTDHHWTQLRRGPSIPAFATFSQLEYGKSKGSVTVYVKASAFSLGARAMGEGDIDYNFALTFTEGEQPFVQGAHDAFPAYEIYVVDEAGNVVGVYVFYPESKEDIHKLHEPNDDIKPNKTMDRTAPDPTPFFPGDRDDKGWGAQHRNPTR